MIALRPCPFCGDANPRYGDSDDGGRFIVCGNQGCQTSSKLMYPLKGDVDDLLASFWNLRKPDAELMYACRAAEELCETFGASGSPDADDAPSIVARIVRTAIANAEVC